MAALIVALFLFQNVAGNGDFPSSGLVWQAIGGVGISDAETDNHSIDVDADGRAWVAFRDLDYDRRTSVLIWNGKEWNYAGERGFSGGPASNQQLKFAPNGVPWIVYRDLDMDRGTTVRRWTGVDWEVVGNRGISAGAASHQAITFDSDGHPVIVYRDWANDSKTTVLKWDGLRWLPLGGMGISEGISDFHEITSGEEGVLWVAYEDNARLGAITVLKWNPETEEWSDFGESSTDMMGRHINLETDHDGNLWIAFEDYNHSRKTTVKRWNREKEKWEFVGNPGISEARAWYQRIQFHPNGTPWISYLDGGDWPGPEQWKPTVRFWNGQEWRAAGDRGISRMGADNPSFVIDSNGRPWIAYTDEYNFNRTTVRRWQLRDDSQPDEEDMREELPVITALFQNYPNPFNPTTNIEFNLPSRSDITLDIYTYDGRHVERLLEGRFDRGTHKATFNGSGLASGTYVYLLRVNGIVTRSRTMQLIK
jgi:hypothetical protein